MVTFNFTTLIVRFREINLNNYVCASCGATSILRYHVRKARWKNYAQLLFTGVHVGSVQLLILQSSAMEFYLWFNLQSDSVTNL